MSITTITLGHGAVVIGNGNADGAKAIFLEPAPAPGPVGGDAAECGLPMDGVVDGSVIIRFESRAGAQVLVDAIARAMQAMPAGDINGAI